MASYGQLWDAFPAVVKRSEEAMDACRDVVAYVYKRSAIEKEYAKSLIALAKSEQKIKKGVFSGSRVAQKERGTLLSAWLTLQNETEAIGQSHLDLSKLLVSDVVEPLVAFIKEKEKAKKTLVTTGARVLRDLRDSIDKYERQNSKIAKLQKELEILQADIQRGGAKQAKAQQKYDVTHHKLKLTTEDNTAMEASVRELQHKVYANELPVVLNDLQSLEEQRVDFLTGSTLETYVALQEATSPAMGTACQVMRAGLTGVDKYSDIQNFISEHNSGKEPPAALDMQAGQFASSSEKRRSAMIKRPETMDFKSIGQFDDFSSLPAAERKARVKERMAQVRKTMTIEVKQTKGMETLMSMYESQPALKANVQSQLSESKTKISILEDQASRYTGILRDLGEEVEEDGADAASAGYGGASYAASGEDYAGGQAGAYAEGGDEEDELVPVNPFQVRALYDFEGDGENELPFAAGDLLNVTAQGQSGWWEATGANGVVGLIPSNYVDYA